MIRDIVQECPAKNNLKILRGVSRCHLANKKSKNYSAVTVYIGNHKKKVRVQIISATQYATNIRLGFKIADNGKNIIQLYVCLREWRDVNLEYHSIVCFISEGNGM